MLLRNHIFIYKFYILSPNIFLKKDYTCHRDQESQIYANKSQISYEMIAL